MTLLSFEIVLVTLRFDSVYINQIECVFPGKKPPLFFHLLGRVRYREIKQNPSNIVLRTVKDMT